MNICRCSVLRPSLLLTWFFEGNYVLLLLGGDSRMTVVLANEQRLYVAAQVTVWFVTSVKCCMFCWQCGLLGSFLFARFILRHILCRKDLLSLFLHHIDKALSFELNFRLWPPSFVTLCDATFQHSVFICHAQVSWLFCVLRMPLCDFS